MEANKPAILGGKCVFKQKIGIIRPVLNKYADRLSQEYASILHSNMVSGVNIKTKMLEEGLKAIVDAKHVISLSSCTMGMILAIQALGLRDTEIILPSFSFSATAHMLYWNNCTPKFVDISPETFNITPETIMAALTPKTK
nr:DegT/DnrJ/EryC1/StrS family aminotransferase [Candidatus Sigynarchaeota archaeon]